MQQSQFSAPPPGKGDYSISFTEIIYDDTQKAKVNFKQVETEEILKDNESSPKSSLKCPDMNSDEYFGSSIAQFFLVNILQYMRWLKKNIIDRSLPLQQNFLPNLSESQKNQQYSQFCVGEIDKIIKRQGKITRYQLYMILIFGKKLKIIFGVLMSLSTLIITRCILSILLSMVIQANLDGQSLDYQLFLGGMIAIVNFSSVMAQHNYYLWGYKYSNIYRMTIQVLVFNRLISLKQYQIVENQIGKVINMISSDMNTIEPFLIYIFIIPMIPLTFGLSGAILWIRFDGPIGLLLPVILLLCYPIQVMFQNIMIDHVKQSKSFSDQRVKLTNELIEGIRLLKMYAWEEAFKKLILNLNGKEVYHHVRTGVAFSLQKAICGYAQLWGSFIFFLIVHYSGLNELNVPIMASTIQLAFFFRFFSITLFSYGLDAAANIWINITRLESVLSTLPTQYFLEQQAQEAVIMFNKYDAYWSKSAQNPTLQNINLRINQGEIISVVGRVGSGKTTFLHALLEQIPSHSGELRFNGTDLKSSRLKISYVEQEPFIFPDSIKNNILFGKEYNQSLYEQVIWYASLNHDLLILPHGDLTQIGEKGVNLSGGQRARVSVARALYQEADIYLFDDPLSAVDAKVAKHLFENAFKGYSLRKKGEKCPIVILATHQVQYAVKCDKILVLDQGQMVQYGTFAEVQDSLNMIGDALLAQLQVKTVDEVSEPPTAASASLPVSKKQEISIQLYKTEQQKAATLGLHTYMRFFNQWPSVILLGFIITFNVISELCYQMMYRYTSMFNKTYSPNTVFIILAGLMGGALISNLFKFNLHLFSLMHANIKTHRDMLESLCQSPVSYFDTTPSGRILNRFSSDKSLQDYVLHLLFTDIYELQSAFIVSMILISILQPYFAIGVAIILLTIALLIRFAYQMIIQTKEFDLISKSPVFDFFKIALNGIITINISEKEQYFKDKFQELTNNSAKANLIFYQVSTLFGYSVHLSCTVVQVVGIFLVIRLNQDDYSSFSQALLTLSIFCDQQQWAARQMIQVHALMSSTQRMYEIVDLAHEAPQVKETDDELKENWPSVGEISFKNVSMRYRVDTDLVLKGMSFQVRGGEKVGCVGRTGAGKSSILQALFRMSEIEQGINQSGIFIDGVDTAKIGLSKLRSSIAIIPQSPFLFSGTIRRNLDPLEQHDDKRLYQVLDNVELKQVVDKLPQGLDTDMSEANQVFSVGQKQLICLARAIIGNKKIVVLDEATANLDMRTDELIQVTIKGRFKESTVITIAHRLNTVADYDKILVIQDGKVLEMGSPLELLCENPNDTDITRNSSFANLVKNTGPENAKSILNLAKKAKKYL